jgi:uncharacterized delta-60 repeat protein
MDLRQDRPRLRPRGCVRAAFVFGMTVVFGFAFAPSAVGTPGDLDTSFSGDGIVTTDIARGIDHGHAMVIQNDGKIIVVGGAGEDLRNTKFAVARYNSDGTIDTSFGGDGKVTTNLTRFYDAAYGVAIQSDGKIVVAGDAGLDGPNSAFGVVRYNSDGSLDTTFGRGDGIVVTHFSRRHDPVAGLAVQADDRIVVSGAASWNGANPKMALARYTADGRLDPTFGRDGRVTTDFGEGMDFANAVTLTPDGDIVAAGLTTTRRYGADFALARYNVDGTLDVGFGGDGKVRTRFTRAHDSVQALVVAADGSVVVAGIAACCGDDASFALGKYGPDGSLDTSFGNDGKVTTEFSRRDDYAYGLAVQGDQMIVAAGVAAAGSDDSKIAVSRYTPDGTPDATFSSDGRITTNISNGYDASRGIGIQPDGKIVVSGNSAREFAVVRYVIV